MITAGKFFELAKNREAHFWGRVDQSSGPDGCWHWRGANDGRRGYGKIKLGSYESARTHRVAYALQFGPIPEGLDVLHRCDNPPCCNPAHLFLGTHDTNMADMVAKGRAKGGSLAGELNNRAILTAAQAEEIKCRILAGERNTDIAKDYGIGDDMISRIRRGKAWGDEPLTARYSSVRKPRAA